MVEGWGTSMRAGISDSVEFSADPKKDPDGADFIVNK